VFDASTQTAFGVTASGGPQEVVAQGSQIVWTIGGVASGSRSLSLSGQWYANPAAPSSGNTFTYPWAGGAQAAPVTITFSQAP
jgi:hypothetical protein